MRKTKRVKSKKWRKIEEKWRKILNENNEKRQEIKRQKIEDKAKR